MAKIVIDDHFIKTLIPEDTITNSEAAVKIVLEGILRNSKPFVEEVQPVMEAAYEKGWNDRAEQTDPDCDKYCHIGGNMKYDYIFDAIRKIKRNEKQRTKTGRNAKTD